MSRITKVEARGAAASSTKKLVITEQDNAGNQVVSSIRSVPGHMEVPSEYAVADYDAEIGDVVSISTPKDGPPQAKRAKAKAKKAAQRRADDTAASIVESAKKVFTMVEEVLAESRFGSAPYAAICATVPNDDQDYAIEVCTWIASVIAMQKRNDGASTPEEFIASLPPKPKLRKFK